MVIKITKKLLIYFVFILCLNLVATQHRCFQGTFAYTPRLRGRDVCELCPDGTFMPLKDHDYRECFNCTEIQDPVLEIFVTPCNRTQNTVIHCIDGYFRQLLRNPREQEKCVKCTECDYPILSCGTYSDTHCCQGENVVPNKDGATWLCNKDLPTSTTDAIPVRPEGQLLQRESGDYSATCKPCPTGTYMDEPNNTNTACKHSGNLTKEQLSSASNKTFCVTAENGNVVVAGAVGFAFGCVFCVCLLACGAFDARRYSIMSLNWLDRSPQASDQGERSMEEGDQGEVEACLKRSP